MKNKLLLILSLFLSSFIWAQPANDNCTGATNLGTLGTPGNCGNGIKNGAVTTVAATNVASTPENPYTTLAGCGMASPANSVWYMFTAPPKGFGVNIAITNATFANPNIALYNGANCNSLAGINCIVGTGGAATLNVTNGIVPGQTYYIFISGNTGQSGTFTLKVNAYQDCSACLNSADLTVTPLPVNGSYQPGQTVNFCYHINQWTQTTNNWLHGVQMTFGAGWNLATLSTTPPPPYLSTAAMWGGGTPATCGNWQYYPNGITSTANNNSWPAGFYFNGTYTSSIFGGITGCGSATDGDPGNNFGDGVSSSGTVYNPGAGDWNFCWSIQVATGCNPGMSLAVAVNTSGDGESGAWTSSGCTNDPPTTFSALIACCPPNMASTATCPAASTGTATATPVGATGPYVYSWATGGQTTQTATGLAPGTYTVTVIDHNLCAASNTVTVSAYTTPVVTPVANITVCIGGSVSIPALVSTPAGATFAWTNSNPAIGLAASGTGNIPSFTATNATGAPITSTITITPTSAAPQSCPGPPITFTITVAATLNVTVNSPSICSGGAATLTAAGATTYTWSAGATTTGANTATASPATTTTYTVTGTSGTCTATAVATVTVTGSLTITVNSPSICVGQTATLTATGGTTYAWTAGATSSGVTTATAAPTVTTSYTVTGSTGVCTGTAVSTVTVNPIPTVTVPANIIICNGGSIPATNFTSSVAGSTFSWANNNTAIGIGSSGVGDIPAFTATNTGAAAITANITVTPTGPATTNCVGTPSTYTITVNPTPPAPTVVTPVTYCQNAVAVALTATGTGLLWYTAATGGVGSATAPTPSTTTAGTTGYYVSQTIATCEGPRAQIDVVINPTPAPPTVTSPVNYCLNDPTVALAATGSNLLWYTTATGGVGSTTAPTPISTTVGMTSYWVSQTLLGCEGPRAQIDVNITALPVVTVTSPTICAGTSATITGSGATTYTWSAGATSSSVTTATASPASTTSYTVTGTTLGCSGTAVSTVTVNPNPVVIVNSPIICAGQTASLTANGGTTYTWSAGATSTGANTASASPAAATSYTVTGTTLGCIGTAVSIVTVNPLPTATVSGGGNGCVGTVFPSVIITLTGASPWNITYSDGTNSTSISTAVSPYVITNPGVGTYSVTSVSNANCIGTYSGTANVTSNPIPVPSFTAPNNGCKPFCTTFSDASTIISGTITSWTWSFGDGGAATSQNPSYCYNSPGVYSVSLTVSSSAGCYASVTNSNMITVYQVPYASFSCPNNQSILDPLVQFTNYSNGATSYIWNFGDPYSTLPNNTSTSMNPQHLYSALGDYCISLAVTNGHCYDTTQVCLVIQPEFIFYIPNAFSPNGDGINDEFYGKGEGISSYEMWVYDRWGNKIFYGSALDQHWDGTMKGRRVEEDVYVYVVKLFDWKNDEHKYLGTVTVVK